MGTLPYDLRPHLLGGGQVVASGARGFRLELPMMLTGYADAQVDDCKGFRRASFRWNAPISLRLRARASHAALPGTLGFGLWNDPFGLSLGGAGGTQKLPAAPQAAWFFYGSPPNDFTFDPAGMGGGYKAACLRAASLPALVLLPGAAAAFVLSRLPLLSRPIVQGVKRMVSGAEAQIDVRLDEWHEYRLAWRPDGVRFEVDGDRVLDTPIAPRGPLGFVAWIDNQYAVLSERTGIKFGVVPTALPAWLEIGDLEIRSPGVP